ncbi:hypothetical protein RB653_000395 [Dictyostelium firmibasis]|uniref:Uncharacterized protein n=1 Tax=Dictyostelium firmibasis TaxID=79012 RepID=A0AAN7TV62_9MYCE
MIDSFIIISIIKYYIIVWCITFVFKYGKKVLITDNHSNYSYKNLFFKIDFVISLIPFISLVFLFFCCYTNILLFIEIIRENKFQFPNTLWVLFPIAYSLTGILFHYIRFKTIKRNSIKVNVYKEINGTEQLFYENVNLYSYGSDFNKIKFTVLTLLWVILCNFEISEYIDCDEINKVYSLGYGSVNFCNSFHDYSNPVINVFEVVAIITQILPHIFIIPIMELSMVV